MPIVKSKRFRVPAYLLNGHFETIYAGTFRRAGEVSYERERIFTRDNDFLDIDWLRRKSNKLAILCHGLGGNSTRTYMRGMALNLLESGWDILAWNNRGCSEEINRNFRLYHHGDVEDLEDVVIHVSGNTRYEQINFVGFSMGGSQVLKYLSTRMGNLPKHVHRAVVFSVPCNLGDSAVRLSRLSNTIYRNRFLKKLKRKLAAKHHQYPGLINLNLLRKVKNFEQLDRNFTLPFLNLRSLEELYAYGSVIHFIDQLQTPTLLVNAENDPMLPDSCYPFEIAERHKFLYLEVPEKGGHVGFFDGDHDRIWSEKRTLAFFNEKNL